MESEQDLFAFNVEYNEIKYESFLDWFIQFGDLNHHWKYQPTYLISQGVFILGAIATLLHAIIRGGRLPYLWLGTLLHGMVVECISYAVPDVDNFWHSQTPIMFLGRRLPLHIIFLYPCFLYQSSIAVGKMKLPKWSEPFAVGLCTVLIDIPYDIVSVNFLHWTWHDTDPNIYDRHYWVPWNSYYFHACFAASFTFWFHFTRKHICRSNAEKWESLSFTNEIKCTLLAALLGTPGGILMFLPIYHPLHDIFKIHSEVTFFIIFTIFLLMIWIGDRTTRKNMEDGQHKIHWSSFILLIHLISHYASFLAMTIFFKPENEIAIGLKEPIGNCSEVSPVHTAFGMTLEKKKYLCATNYDEKYFNWECLYNQSPPSEGSVWYTACGVPLPNKEELIVIISLICILGATIFTNLHFNSFGDNIFKQKKEETATKVKKDT